MLKFGRIVFKYRDYTPIPFVIVMIIYAKATMETLILGTICLLIGEFIRYIGVAYIGGVSRTRTFSTGQKLITGGIFSHVRNPLYIGNLLLSTGLIIFANVHLYFTIGFVIFFFLQYIPMILWEENNLRGVFGEEFVEYCNKVPRWIPAIMPKMPSNEKIKGEYVTAAKSEKSTVLAALLLYGLIIWRSGLWV